MYCGRFLVPASFVIENLTNVEKGHVSLNPLLLRLFVLKSKADDSNC